MTELWSRECVNRRHRECDGTVATPAELIPAGQDFVRCHCRCHRRPAEAGRIERGR